MDKKNTGTIISIILAFILTIDLFLLTMITSTVSTVLDKSYMKDKLSNSGYYTEALKKTIDNFDNLPANIPLEVFKNAVDEVRIYNDFSPIIEASYKGETYRVDTSILETNLKNAFLEYANEQNIEITDEENENLDGLVKYCSDSYKTIIDNKIITYIGQFSARLNKFIIPAFIGITVLAVFLITFLYKLHYYKHKALRYMSYSFTAAFIMTIIIPIVILIDKVYMKLQITPEYMLEFIIKMIEGFLLYLLFSGIFMGVIAACLITSVALIRKKYKKASARKNW